MSNVIHRTKDYFKNVTNFKLVRKYDTVYNLEAFGLTPAERLAAYRDMIKIERERNNVRYI